MRRDLQHRNSSAGPWAFSRDAARRSARRRAGGNERGDVPGWVLITLMTAGLVLVLWGVAGPALSDVFTSAIQSVTGEIGG